MTKDSFRKGSLVLLGFGFKVRLNTVRKGQKVFTGVIEDEKAFGNGEKRRFEYFHIMEVIEF